MLYIRLSVLCFGVVGVWALKERSGGFQKFPASSCGMRSISWSPQREPRIIGGEEPPHGAIPWQVQLRRGREHQCGGVLLASRLVLTVAHCWTEGLVAVIGRGRPGKGYSEQTVRVEHTVAHPDFRKYGPYSNDIAVIVLAKPGFKLGWFAQPVCVPPNSPPPGTWCEVSGWGATNSSDPERLSPVLRSAAVPLISLENCRKDGIYGGRQQAILDSMVCAGHLSGGIDACGGDSGGPLVCEQNGRMDLTGIVSWGDGCAKRDRPGVYTRVSSYISWIKQVARQYGIEYQ